FVDRPSQVLPGGDPVGVTRRELVGALFHSGGSIAGLLERLPTGRPHLVWVGEVERRAAEDLEPRLAEAAFETVFERGGVRLWLAPGSGRGAWDAAAREALEG
ncbi:MAG: hypothetical protein AAFZ65_07620, partial [Planctomycetota bacterium]